MKSRLSLLAALCAALLSGAPSALADSPGASDTPVHYYVSLGDSLAAGEQPSGDLTHGYAEQLFAELKEENPTLRLVKLGCAGETSASMIFRQPIWVSARLAA